MQIEYFKKSCSSVIISNELLFLLLFQTGLHVFFNNKNFFVHLIILSERKFVICK